MHSTVRYVACTQSQEGEEEQAQGGLQVHADVCNSAQYEQAEASGYSRATNLRDDPLLAAAHQSPGTWY